MTVEVRFKPTLSDAAPGSDGGEAQEAAAAKLRTVFARRNLIGPKLPFIINL
ncbi:hypothetical protein ACUXV3_16565 [Roseobacteraceae bacterium NS-SX3]